MKANKAHKRLAKIEESVSDVMERYSAASPHTREVLQAAKAAVTGAKDAVKSQESSKETSDGKKGSNTRAEVKVPPAKATKKHGTTKKDYEG